MDRHGLSPTGSPKGSRQPDVVELPEDAATIMNLCILGIKTREETEAYLKDKYPKDYEEWLLHLP